MSDENQSGHRMSEQDQFIGPQRNQAVVVESTTPIPSNEGPIIKIERNDRSEEGSDDNPNDPNKEEIDVSTRRYRLFEYIGWALTFVIVLTYTIVEWVYYASDANTNEYEDVEFNVDTVDPPMIFADLWILPSWDCYANYDAYTSAEKRYFFWTAITDLTSMGPDIDGTESISGNWIPNIEVYNSSNYGGLMLVSLPDGDQLSVDRDQDSSTIDGVYFGVWCNGLSSTDVYWSVYYDMGHSETFEDLWDSANSVEAFWTKLMAIETHLAFGTEFSYYYSVFDYNNKKHPSQTDPSYIDEEMYSFSDSSFYFGSSLTFTPDPSGRSTTYVVDWKKGWLDILGEIGGAYSLVAGVIAVIIMIAAYGVEIGSRILFAGFARYAVPSGSTKHQLDAYMVDRKYQ